MKPITIVIGGTCKFAFEKPKGIPAEVVMKYRAKQPKKVKKWNCPY